MSTPANHLERFIDAQLDSYEAALSEIRAGRKRTHWMWYVFPQLAGLGRSETARYFALANISEAATYLSHPVLGKRLIDISRALLQLPHKDAGNVFGTPDDLKLHSSMTLFSLVPGADPVFQQVIDKFFDSVPDHLTLQLIGGK